MLRFPFVALYLHLGVREPQLAHRFCLVVLAPQRLQPPLAAVFPTVPRTAFYRTQLGLKLRNLRVPRHDLLGGSHEHLVRLAHHLS